MFGLGMTEILMILALALIIIGPKKLPELAKTLGHAMGEFKRSAQDFKRSIDVEASIKDLNDIEVSEPNLKDAIKNSDEQATKDPSSVDEDTVYPPENESNPPDNTTPPSQPSSENPDTKS